MNQWGESIQEVHQYLGSAVDELGDLITWFKRDIVGHKRIPEETVNHVNNSLVTMSKSLEHLALAITGVADGQNRAMLSFLGGRRLGRQEFYILLATGGIEWTNKTVGLSDFDDYELFEMLRYESDGRRGYIYLAPDIDDLPDVEPDDWTLNFISRTYRKAIIAPEAIQWSTLTTEQRRFFEKYLPDTVTRFLHDE